MGKLIVLIVLVIIVVLAIKRALQPPPTAGKKPAVEGELVACAHCGVHLPKNEARAAGGALYCSEEHARLGRAAR